MIYAETNIHLSVIENDIIFLAASRLGKYPPLFTSTIHLNYFAMCDPDEMIYEMISRPYILV